MTHASHAAGRDRRRIIGAIGTVVAALALAGGPVGASDLLDLSPSTSGTPAPITVVLEDGGDGWINAAEESAGVMVTGTYDNSASPAVDEVNVRILDSAICDGGAPATPNMQVPVNGDGTFTVGPFDTSIFLQGATLCAKARLLDVNASIGPPADSNLATRDTIAPADGTVEMVETFIVDGYLNLREATDMCCIQANSLNADGSASSSSVWFEDVDGDITAGCGPWTVGVNNFGALPAGCAESMDQGTFEFLGQWRDPAGNLSGIASASLVKDTLPPLLSILQPDADGFAVAPSTDLTLSGTTVPGGPVVYRLNGVVLESTTAEPDGTWETTISAPSLDGIHEFKVTTRDQARNFSTRVRLFVVDSTIPIIINPAEGSLEPGAVTVTGTAPSASTVEVFEGATLIGSTQADATGDWSLVTGLPTGIHTIVARAITTTNIVSPLSAPRTFRVDAGRPILVITTADGSMHPTGTTITGTAADATEGVAQIVVEYYNALGTRVLVADATCATCGAGALSVSWEHAPALPLPGPYTVVAYAVDTAGNRSLARSIRILGS